MQGVVNFREMNRWRDQIYEMKQNEYNSSFRGKGTAYERNKINYERNKIAYERNKIAYGRKQSVYQRNELNCEVSKKACHIQTDLQKAIQ